jgi:hypothetical protein
VRIVFPSLLLPTKSLWLNPIASIWVYGKRKVVESDEPLGAYELADRAREVFDCDHEPHLYISQKVA